jgi:hypothetical protein
VDECYGVKVYVTFGIFDGFHAFNLCVDVACFDGFGGVDGFDVVNGFNNGFVTVDGSGGIAGIDAISSVVFLTVLLAVAFLGVSVCIGSGLLTCCWQCHFLDFFVICSSHGGR